MAREHHCPNCGPQACNATTSKIHTCGVCAAIWEEDLSVATSTLATPPAPAPKLAAAPTPPPTKPVSPAAPAAPASPSPAPKPATSATPPAAAPAAAAAKAPTASAPGNTKTLADVVAMAKVKRCPKCTSDGVARPGDFRVVQGKFVLADSQTYRAHEWYADTGELLPAAAASAKPTSAVTPAAKTTAAT